MNGNIHGERTASEPQDRSSSAAHSIEVPSEIIRKWQEIVNLLAEILHVPSASIMRVDPPHIKVFVSSTSKGNPCEPGALDTGPYCETVMRTGQPLLVPDALENEAWKANPHVKLGMISYLGVPIGWPDGRLFGTICVRDNKRNKYSEAYLKLLLHFRDMLQADLTAIMRAQRAEASLLTVQAELTRVGRVATLGQLTASIAHEVTQPIASSRNNARAALNFLDRQPPDLGEVKEALKCVLADADRAGDIVDRIRDHIKKAPPRKGRFDLNKAINEVIALAESAITTNGVSVRTRLAEALLPVQGDHVQLQQVVLNLILNAVEAMNTVEAGPRELLISTEQTQTGGVLVFVRDSGPGIDPDHVDRVFEAFYTTKSSGVGMGLSICRSIIDAHGGRLWATRCEPRGALFQFTIPAD
jgi:signal transduction histidine kinase